MRLSQLRLKEDERGAIVGQTGTGKSVLAAQLLPKTGELIVIDPKRMFHYPGLEIVDTVKKAFNVRNGRFIYRPHTTRFSEIEEPLNAIFGRCLNNGDCFIYVDDLVGIVDKSKYPKLMEDCYKMGRAKNVAMLSAMQRPAWYPLFTLSECQKFYIFNLFLKPDVKRVQEMIGDYQNENLPDRHTFFFKDIYSDNKPSMMKINLNSKGGKS
jgi:energy-coupling factor transporter ATP-binding protein EcfA2